MKRKNYLFTALFASVIVAGIPCNVKAGNSYFDVTHITDPVSLREKKDGGSQYENKFYVRGVYFSKSGTLQCNSNACNGTNSSFDAYISRGKPRSSAKYVKKAVANAYYYMSASATYNNGMRVTGWYTP